MSETNHDYLENNFRSGIASSKTVRIRRIVGPVIRSSVASRRAKLCFTGTKSLYLTRFHNSDLNFSEVDIRKPNLQKVW